VYLLGGSLASFEADIASNQFGMLIPRKASFSASHSSTTRSFLKKRSGPCIGSGRVVTAMGITMCWR